MSFKVVTPPAECINLAEAKLHLRIDDVDGQHPDDPLIDGLITAARAYAEHYTGRAIGSQTLEMALDAFPCHDDRVIELPRGPVASITSVKYTDLAGVEQTVSPSAYSLSLYGDADRLAPAYATYWPATQNIPDAVRIRYVTGDTAVKKQVKQAMLLHIALEYPGNDYTPQQREAMQKARDELLNTVKVWGR